MHMSPALNGSSVVWRFERSNAIEICDGIIFNFYTELSNVIQTVLWLKFPSVCMRYSSPHLPVTPAQLMRPGIGQNVSCTMGDFT